MLPAPALPPQTSPGEGSSANKGQQGETEARRLPKWVTVLQGAGLGWENVCCAAPHLLSAGRAGRCRQLVVSALNLGTGLCCGATGTHGWSLDGCPGPCDFRCSMTPCWHRDSEEGSGDFGFF